MYSLLNLQINHHKTMYKIDINDNYLNSVKQLSFEHFIETFHLKTKLLQPNYFDSRKF